MTTPQAPVRTVPPTHTVPSVPTDLATVVQVLAVMVAALVLLRAVAALAAGGDLAAWAGDRPSAAVTAVGVLSTLAVLGQVLAGILGCVWLHLHVLNARLLNPAGWHDRAPLWSYLGWVAPIVCLWFPYQVVRDGAASVGAPTRPVGWWWATWLALQVLAAVEVVVATRVVDDATPLAAAAVVSAMATAAAAVLWVRVVRSMTAAAEGSHQRWLGEVDTVVA
ncbi:DUF4328 domain-containing protein [Janibacter terrae]|uniref:DUF4328 domain-containing protein n=1 Tax=Janibacter terrae TaxID=103817 RepID=A0ABZ2FC52_9MICO